jgi:hypothetical protein
LWHVFLLFFSIVSRAIARTPYRCDFLAGLPIICPLLELARLACATPDFSILEATREYRSGENAPSFSSLRGDPQTNI